MGFNRLMRIIKRLKKLLPDFQEASLAGYFRGMRREAVPPKSVILVQCVEDIYYLGLFGQIVSSLREKQPARVEQYVARCLNIGEADSVFAFIKARLIINPLLCFKWGRLFSSFCDGVAFRGTSFYLIGDTIDFYRAWKSWRGLTDKDSLLSLQIDTTIVGDLINDGFLRYKPAPTVDLKDNYILILLWQAHRYVRRSRAYFARVRPKLYLTSYSTYIHHGIPVRVALECGIRVFSFGNYQEFTKELTHEDWVHTKKTDFYATEFLKLDRQSERLALAEKALTARLSGGVDDATAYMKKSAYAETGNSVPNVRGAVVVFLHDFYDSPHVYQGMVFPDFWEWVCFTIETLTQANIRFFLKPHPNQINLSNQVLSELKQCYPGLLMVSSGVTNKQLVEAGMCCAVTVYGTVAHEMAYLGIPSIACAHHPHISFGFCKTGHSRSEYAELLLNSTKFRVDKVTMRHESLVFYYMHNLNLSNELIMLNNASMLFRMNCEKNDKMHDLVGILKEISALAGFRTTIDRMVECGL